MIGSSDRFLFIGGDKTFEKLKKNSSITESKILDQSKLSFPIQALFRRSCLIFLLSLAMPYLSDIVYEFFANLHIDSDHSKLSSYVFYVDVEFTKENLCLYLQITGTGPSAYVDTGRRNWTSVNKFLRGKSVASHLPEVSGLLPDPRVIQHVLRHSILAKAGDRTKITPVLSFATYFIAEGISFDVADLLIWYFEHIAQAREATTAKKINVALGHVIAYLIQ